MEMQSTVELDGLGVFGRPMWLAEEKLLKGGVERDICGGGACVELYERVGRGARDDGSVCGRGRKFLYVLCLEKKMRRAS